MDIVFTVRLSVHITDESGNADLASLRSIHRHSVPPLSSDDPTTTALYRNAGIHIPSPIHTSKLRLVTERMHKSRAAPSVKPLHSKLSLKIEMPSNNKSKPKETKATSQCPRQRSKEFTGRARSGSKPTTVTSYGTRDKSRRNFATRAKW